VASFQRDGSRTVEVTLASPNRLAVNGALTFETARSAYEAGLRALRESPSGDTVEVDLSRVTESDSAGLAVLIEWTALARRQGRVLRAMNAPQGILASARIAEVDGILGFASP
jgi:phospholipid transport system transporter-binding protein